MAADLTGTYLTLDDGRPAVRFSRVHDHPIDRVWRFVTDPDELAAWFPSRAEFDLRPGGTVRFSGDPNMPESTGTVLAVDAPRHLSFAWGGDELRFDLEEPGEGRTRFTLTNVLGERNAAARNGAGWEVCLAALEAKSRGGRSEGPHAGPTAPWKEYYEAYVEAGVPSGAPVPGADA
ncbi:SRPBCC family protein [Streptomyces cynarae]|uniref:SRPBCC family protein n=1 Tax=Streptomyces cynarae TaxID=2981134 RepID=A0ABY6EAK5_9ACTN|nr:SRPBCC family protein [Streptomyces cynarae]UXY23735.1 SRPBCC family protein [Streptomyces cynarae]